MEKTILYCDSTGRGNTELVLAAAKKRAKELNIRDVVVTTTHGGARAYVDWKPNPEYMNTLVEYMKFVPDEALSDFFVLGTADDCAEKIDEFIEAGVTHFVMDAVAEDYGKFVRDFGQVLSAVRD